jgi:hypothetical protein
VGATAGRTYPSRQRGVRAGVWELDDVDGGTRFRWSEDIALHVPLVGELAARAAYRPVLRMLMSRAQRSLRAYLIAIGPVR